MVSLTEVYDLTRASAVAVGALANSAPCPVPGGGRVRALGGLVRAEPTAPRALADTPAAGVRATLSVRVPTDPLLEPSLLMGDLAARASAASAAVAAALAPAATAGCATNGAPPLCGFLGRLAVAAGVPPEALGSATTAAVSAAALPTAPPSVGADGGGAGAPLAGGPLAGAVLAALAGCAVFLATWARWRAASAPAKPAAGLSPRTSPAIGGAREAAQEGGATLNPLMAPHSSPAEEEKLAVASAALPFSNGEGAAGTVPPQLLRALQFAAYAGRPSARSTVVGRFPTPRSPAARGGPGSGGSLTPGASPPTPAELRGTLRG